MIMRYPGIIGLSLWCFLAPAFAQDDYLQESARKARELLQKATQAMGGEAFMSLKDITTNGRYYQFRKDELQGGSVFETFRKPPHKSRTDFGKKKEIIHINDGDKGWKIEYKQVKEQTPEEIESFKASRKHSLDYILRFRLDEPELKLRYLGQSRLNLEEIEGVELIDKDNDRVKVFISATSFLPAKMEYTSPAFGKRGPTEDEEFFYNYHDIQGVQVPFSMVRFSNGYKALEIRTTGAKVNTGLTDSVFTPQAK
ncbi:MAG: hypothetical protein AB1898_05015 [Acidobacteriota bacterium]